MMPTHAESVAAGGRQVGQGRNEPIELVPYDPTWPGVFEEMRARLATALGPVALRIDHVGSTAVPGLAAKPVIDIQVSVPDVDDESAYKEAMESQGLELRWIEPGHRYFRPPPDLPRLYHVHVCSTGSEWERVHLLFRDHLRTHGDSAQTYEALKGQLARDYRGDRIGYTDAKSPFIEDVLVRAERWAKETGWRP
jgi:GrpB-like predicted nucleotidyltransferase (UPF0157 family)